MQSFITGSHAYGSPHADSDIDIVIMTDQLTADFLASILDTDDCSETIFKGSHSLRAGKANLIVCWEQWVYDIWLKGTQQCQQLRMQNNGSITRDQAKAVFANLRFNTPQTAAELVAAFNPETP